MDIVIIILNICTLAVVIETYRNTEQIEKRLDKIIGEAEDESGKGKQHGTQAEG